MKTNNEIKEIAVQVNGKVRATINILVDEEEESIKEKALACDNVKRHLEGLTVQKILVIKDSYANSFIQFLINNYNEVYVVDLRSFIGSFTEFYSNNNFDKVLIMYSFKNLVNDVNISRIKY